MHAPSALNRMETLTGISGINLRGRGVKSSSNEQKEQIQETEARYTDDDTAETSETNVLYNGIRPTENIRDRYISH